MHSLAPISNCNQLSLNSRLFNVSGAAFPSVAKLADLARLPDVRSPSWTLVVARILSATFQTCFLSSQAELCQLLRLIFGT